MVQNILNWTSPVPPIYFCIILLVLQTLFEDIYCPLFQDIGFCLWESVWHVCTFPEHSSTQSPFRIFDFYTQTGTKPKREEQRSVGTHFGTSAFPAR